jgi:probable DNA metabolism protein
MTQLELFEIPKDEEKKEKIKEKIAQLGNLSEKEAFSFLKQEVFFALLNRDPNKYEIIDKVIDQAEQKGISYVLCKVSAEARKFIHLARQVSAERYRATAFLRLQPIDQYKVLMGEFELRHHTAELIMLHFMKRFPQYTIILIFGDEAVIGKNGAIQREKIDRKKITLPKQPDEFEKYWLAFYKSQFIPERLNLKYLKRMIPKKYWRWVTELKEFGLN